MLSFIRAKTQARDSIVLTKQERGILNGIGF
jgi:hypothetical protein